MWRKGTQWLNAIQTKEDQPSKETVDADVDVEKLEIDSSRAVVIRVPEVEYETW